MRKSDPVPHAIPLRLAVENLRLAVEKGSPSTQWPSPGPTRTSQDLNKTTSTSLLLEGTCLMLSAVLLGGDRLRNCSDEKKPLFSHVLVRCWRQSPCSAEGGRKWGEEWNCPELSSPELTVIASPDQWVWIQAVQNVCYCRVNSD